MHHDESGSNSQNHFLPREKIKLDWVFAFRDVAERTRSHFTHQLQHRFEIQVQIDVKSESHSKNNGFSDFFIMIFFIRKILASVYDIRPLTTHVIGYEIDLRCLSFLFK